MNADPIDQINTFVLHLGSWRCCQRCIRGDSKETIEEEYICKACKQPRARTGFSREDRKRLIPAGRSDELVCITCRPPKEFLQCAGQEFPCEVCGLVAFEKFDEGDQCQIAFDKRSDRIKCTKCRAETKQIRDDKRLATLKLKCSNCPKPLPLSAFPETIQKRVLERGGTTSIKALCTKCRDEADHKECIECHKRKHIDDFGRTIKRQIRPRCRDCEGHKEELTNPVYRCQECQLYKPTTDYTHESRHRSLRCRVCEYPVCSTIACGQYRHPFHEKAIFERNKIGNAKQW